MAKKQNSTSPFWKPVKKGEEITGKFAYLEQTSFGNKKRKKGENQHGMAIRLLSGVLIGITYTIGQAFATIAKKIKTNDPIRVVYDGPGGKSSYGKPVKLFTLYWKGKKVERPSSFGQPADKKEVKDFLLQFEAPKPGELPI